MLLDGCPPGPDGLKMATQPHEQRPAAGIPKGLHGFDKHRIRTGLGDGGVKRPVARQRHHALVGISCHARNRLAHGIDVFSFGQQGCNRSSFALDDPACTDELQRPPFLRRQQFGL